MDKIELDTCPFCGAEAILKKLGCDLEKWHEEEKD